MSELVQAIQRLVAVQATPEEQLYVLQTINAELSELIASLDAK